MTAPSTRASSRSDRASTSAAGGRQLKTPAGWPSVTGVSGAAHAAQVEVEHAAEVTRGVVAGLPPAQVAVHHDGVEQRLQRVVGVQHRRRRAGPGRTPPRSAARSGSPRRLVL